jgi:uncharacterized protein
MKIGVISDTHGEIVLTKQAVGVFDNFQVELILHCGDIGLKVVPLFVGHRVHFVPGNMDDADAVRCAISEGEHTLHEQPGTLTVRDCRIAFLHGHDIKLLYHTIHSGHWDLVCHGHTHIASSNREGETLVVNPGALVRTATPSVAVVDLPSLEVTEVLLG